MAVGLLIFGWNWLRETRSALAYSRRELQPWEIAEQEAQGQAGSGRNWGPVWDAVAQVGDATNFLEG